MDFPLTTPLQVRNYLSQKGLYLNAPVNLVDIGNINFVYRLDDPDQGTVYLKSYGVVPRRTTPAIDLIGFEPLRYLTERDALQLFRRVLDPSFSDVIPKILYFDFESRVMIMSDIARNGEILREILLKDPQQATTTMAPLGALLGQQRARTIGYQGFFQPEAFNRRFYDFRTIHSSVALSVTQQQTITQRAQQIWDANASFACLINGDFSPKQIYVSNAGIGICDLELVSLGVASYDIGFFVGQMKLLEYITENALVGDLALQFLDSYFATLILEVPDRLDFITFTREHVDFFIGLGILNRLDAVPLEKFIPPEKVSFLRECALTFIFK